MLYAWMKSLSLCVCERHMRVAAVVANKDLHTYINIINLIKKLPFLANVNSCSRSLYVVVRPSVCLSVVCNVRAPYSGD